MSPEKNNWQDLASDLGLSFEIDPNAPEIPPEPEPVVTVEQTSITTISVETSLPEVSQDAEQEESLDSSSGEPGSDKPGEEGWDGNRKRRRGRRRRRGRGEAGGPEDGASPGEDLQEAVPVAVGAPLAEMSEMDEDDSDSGSDSRSGGSDEEFVLEDLTNLSVPSWTELIDSLYRPDR